MKMYIVTVGLNCYVLKESEYCNTHPIKKGLRPNFLYRDNFHTGVVFSCDEDIKPGTSGFLEAKLFIDEASLTLLKEGQSIGIFEGPENKLATCDILNIIGTEEI